MNKVVEISMEEACSAILEGRNHILEQIDDAYCQAFMLWAKKRYYATPQYFEDAWWEAIAAFYQGVKKGKIEPKGYKLKTVLFFFAGRYLMKTFRKLKPFLFFRADEVDALIKNPLPELLYLEWEESWMDKDREILHRAIKILTPDCQKILAYRHFDGLDIEEIREKMEHKNTNVTSARLSTCLSRLIKLINNTPDNE